MTSSNPIVSGNTISLERTIKAPVELVFEAWIKPEHIQHWWGPAGFTNTISQMDTTPGGEWVFVMHGPDGKDYPNVMKYKELELNKKIVMEHTVQPYFCMTVLFEAQGNHTCIKITNEFESAEMLQQIIKAVNAAEGLKQNIDKLEDHMHLQDLAISMEVNRTFKAPKLLVWQAFTEAAHFSKWWGPKGCAIQVAQLDLKPGGLAHYNMQMPNGAIMWGMFKYIDLQAPDKIVFINSFSDADGGLTGNPYLSVWPLEVQNTLTLESQADGTTLLTIKGYPINASMAERQAFANMTAMMKQGFGGTFNSLDHHLAVMLAQGKTPIVMERVLNAPVEKVWRAITNKDEIKQWSFDIAAFEPIPGFEFSFKGGKPDGIVYTHLCKVVAADECRKLSYTWQYEGFEGTSLVTMELTAQGNQTHFKLTHSDMENMQIENDNFAVDNFIAGWTNIIHTLLTNYVENKN